MVRFKKKHTLKGQLIEMSIGDSTEISQRRTGYKPHIVREAISRLKKDGYRFECTERGLVDAIRVTRLE